MILVIDNYDSFTWNLVQYLGELGADPLVKRNDEITLAEIESMKPRGIVISPGPGRPADAGISIQVVTGFGKTVPILGVCLGHQAIAEAYGGRVVRAPLLMHGRTSSIAHRSDDLFSGLPSPLEVMRYHSLTVEAASMPESLAVLAWGVDDPTEIHSIRHRDNPVWGVQFHPESVMTHCGRNLLENFLELSQ